MYKETWWSWKIWEFDPLCMGWADRKLNKIAWRHLYMVRKCAASCLQLNVIHRLPGHCCSSVRSHANGRAVSAFSQWSKVPVIECFATNNKCTYEFKLSQPLLLNSVDYKKNDACEEKNIKTFHISLPIHSTVQRQESTKEKKIIEINP